MPRLHFEDFSPGTADVPGSITVTKEAIVAFAREFDAQPFHTDEAAARKTFAGGLIASGWHTCGLLMRLIADGFINESSSMGAPGVEELKWLKVVRPGDVLRARGTVLETKASRSRPEMGLVRMFYELLNQDGAVVMTQRNWTMLGRRGFEPPYGARANGPAKAEPAGGSPSDDRPSGEGEPAPFFEDVAVGETAALGSYAFTPETVVAFAREYDPQPFHVDPEAAARSHFGALAASGWHTAAAWMKRLVERRTRQREAAIAQGQRPASFGPSPGFTDLKWLKPVYAGDTLTFRTTVVDKRPSSSRPEWGLVLSHNTGHNQAGELVYEFKGAGFVERRR
ncbi:MAG TPA: MaoC family dehydratase [Beijerinckiaceae bacterium]|jgi:acyl dehydratase